jgi:hypothetical protein
VFCSPWPLAMSSLALNSGNSPGSWGTYERAPTFCCLEPDLCWLPHLPLGSDEVCPYPVFAILFSVPSYCHQPAHACWCTSPAPPLASKWLSGQQLAWKPVPVPVLQCPVFSVCASLCMRETDYRTNQLVALVSLSPFWLVPLEEAL